MRPRREDQTTIYFVTGSVTSRGRSPRPARGLRRARSIEALPLPEPVDTGWGITGVPPGRAQCESDSPTPESATRFVATPKASGEQGSDTRVQSDHGEPGVPGCPESGLDRPLERTLAQAEQLYTSPAPSRRPTHDLTRLQPVSCRCARHLLSCPKGSSGLDPGAIRKSPCWRMAFTSAVPRSISCQRPSLLD